GIVLEVDLVPLVPPGPAEDRKIGDRDIVAAAIGDVAQAPVEDAVEALRLLHKALETVAPVGLVLHLAEVVDLAGDRPEAAHLPHQPFEDRDLPPQITLGPELAALLAEIDEDRAALEDADRLAA